MSIKILLDKCTGCTLCVKACPFAAISMIDRPAEAPGKGKRVAQINLDVCTLCGACVASCKFNAIDLKKDLGGVDVDLSHYKDVWVFAEQREGKIQSVAYELLSEGQKLAAECGSQLCAVLLGDEKIENNGDKKSLAWRIKLFLGSKISQEKKEFFRKRNRWVRSNKPGK